ncbi:MAG TPA: D-glycerate dehydrogenase [Thermomicrobiales bacterium]|jgi:lactate dehydrogenase-like 2-hydroxyacid dehydrogenase|nr:D-glycerate dehydrogenase [Thermomicrobiales bacterium]
MTPGSDQGWVIAVCRDIPAAGVNLLRQAPEVGEVRVWPGELPPNRDELAGLLHGCDGAITLLSDRIDGSLLDREPQLRVVANYAVGYDNIDVSAARERGVTVCNTPDVLTHATADCAFALILATARRIVESVDFVRAGRWVTWGPQLLLGQEMYGRTLGIIGPGRIGTEVARRGTGFGMRLLGWSASGRLSDDARALGMESVELDRLIRESDVISIHCPLTPETRHLIGADELARMKPTAILVNTARGPVVDQLALAAALAEGRIAGAGLDVTDPEPPDPDLPLLREPRAVVVPHIGSATVGARDAMATLAAKGVLAVLRGQRPSNVVS